VKTDPRTSGTFGPTNVQNRNKLRQTNRWRERDNEAVPHVADTDLTKHIRPGVRNLRFSNVRFENSDIQLPKDSGKGSETNSGIPWQSQYNNNGTCF
jgi:hypothetical protein